MRWQNQVSFPRFEQDWLGSVVQRRTRLKRICVFCGSSMGSKLTYRLAAEAMGLVLARRGIELVYGGGNIGLMGVVADAVMDAGGKVIGVMPEVLLQKEVGHQGLSQLHIVSSMHERKAMMADLSDAFIALPGGFGTLEEFCEVLTWSQLSIHTKPCGLLNVGGYYDPLITMFDQAMNERFLRPAHRALVLEAQEPEVLIDLLADYQPMALEKWIEPKQR